MHVACRRFVCEQHARAAYERLERRMHARRLYAPQAAPALTAAVGLDADSAAAFVTIIGPDEQEVLREAQRLGGDEVPRAQIPDDYIQGLSTRRQRTTEATGPGAVTRFDYRRPGILRANGIVEPY